jgi:hypothetical protein
VAALTLRSSPPARQRPPRICHLLPIFATPFLRNVPGGHMRTLLVPACVVVSLAAFSPAVHADPVLITGGVGNIGTDLTGFVITGADTSISMTVHSSFSPVEIDAGESVSFTAHVVPEDFSTFGFPVTVNGVNYGNVALEGELTFITGSFTAPPLTPTLRTFSAPGTLSGTLTGSQLNDGAQLFTIDVTGHGVFSSIFHGVGPFEGSNRWWAGIEPAAAIRFDEAGANATPEPASLLLLASGAAGLWMRRRRA